ncbi:MAG TPA: hypothetical protein VEZ20_11830 [Allosphingosinicella sp.]|nr:hypothetical protein [Allosphingosinicella sp.]
MSKLRALLLLTTGLPAIAACGGANDIGSPGEGNIVVVAPAPPAPPPPPPPPSGPATSCPAGTTDAGVIADRRNCRLPAKITSLSLQNLPGTIYSMNGRVEVGTDVGADGSAAGGQAGLLTIAPGAVIFADTQATFLVVNRGSQMVADGTQTRPIVFTSRANVEGTATDASDNQWGGILLLGRAPISNCLGATPNPGGGTNCQQEAEGTNVQTFYGGSIAGDSSGSMRYVQIRYTGFSLAPNRELQGLTTGGVGSGTRLEFIQVHNSGDDGIEIFGGRHNLKNFVVTGADDDTLDTDFGYKGAIQFFIGVQRPQSLKPDTGDAMIEADSPAEVAGAANFTPRQNTRLANFTFIQSRAGRSAIHLRGGTDFALLNGVVSGPTSCLDVDDAETVQAAGAAPDEAGPPIIRSVAFSCPTFANPDADTFEDQALNAAGNTGNNTAFSLSLTGFVNGANENGFAAFTNLSAFDPFFTNVNYIGAVRDANDTWYRGWTCDSSYANFGSGMSCTSIPAAGTA